MLIPQHLFTRAEQMLILIVAFVYLTDDEEHGADEISASFLFLYGK
jgi:hypothetical protein